jgi:ABC-type transport system involved in multi-copper enzyme maturation permease subunit
MPVFDQGYQHWQGPLAGHAWRWLTVARHGVRVQWHNRILRVLVPLAWVPALALVAAVVVWGLLERQSETVLALVRNLLPAEVVQDPRAYRATAWTLAYSFFFKAEVFLVMLLVTVAGPGLISQDLRFNALPLYFSRPLTRLDYFLGKLGVIGALVASVAVAPAVFAYVVGVLFCLDLSVVRDTYPVLLASVAYGLVVTLSAGTLMLALSSLTRRSLYVGIAWAGFWIISGSVGGILNEIHGMSVRREVFEGELARWVAENPPPPGVRMFGSYPELRYDPKTRELRPVGAKPGHEAEADRWGRAWRQASQDAGNKALAGLAEVSRRNWRPLCSYTANLDRVADQLLETDTAWVAIGRAVERSRVAVMARGFGPLGGGRKVKADPANERLLADMMVPQYPWTWSAGVLASLLGLSTWTLTRRVKSLDRLR